MRLYCNGELVRQGDGTSALGDLVDSAAWIINLRHSRGDRIGRGDMLSTGTCTGHFLASPGDELMVDFGTLGRVTATFATTA